MKRVSRTWVLVALGAWSVAPGPLAAQSSPYLHLRHPLYTEIDLLVERGVLRGLSPVVRPYLRGDVARAVLGADTAGATEVERAWVARLTRELSAEIRSLREAGSVTRGAGSPKGLPDGRGERSESGQVGATLAMEGSALSQRHRDPLRPEGKGLLTGAVELDLRAAWSGVAAESRMRSDNYYLHDPQFPERVATNRFNQRAEDAYLEIQGRHVRLMVGRLYRNWAPAGVEGTLLSDYAYSFDQVGLWVGTDELSLSVVAARLDDFPGDVRRHLALHRLDWRPSTDLALYAAEAVLYGGVGRGFELAFLNPVNLWITESDNLRPSRVQGGNNVLGSLGVWWRARPEVIVFGDFTLDDFRVDEGAANGNRYAWFAGVSLPRLGDRLAGRIVYTQVSSLAYRSFADYERYTFREVGLGRDVSDYGQLTGALEWFPTPEIQIGPSVAVRWRGEGDLRDPFPADPDTVRKFLIGTVERTVRLAIQGRVRHRGVLLDGDLGQNWVWSAGHHQGARESEFVGRLRAQVTWSW